MAGETAEDDDKDTDQDLEAGFNTETAPPPLKTEGTKEETPPEPTVEKPQDADGTNAEVTPPAEAKPQKAAPKIRQITEEEFTALRASADKTVSLEKQISTALGTIGNIKQLVTKLQTETPKGTQIALSNGFLKKLSAEFPEIAEMLEDDLNEAFKGIKGTGGEQPTSSQTFSEEEFDKRLQAARLKDAVEALEDEFPTWRKIVGEVDKDGKFDPKNPYRKWLSGKSAEYQEKINSTNNPSIISRSIRLFRKETGKPSAARPSKETTPAKPSPQKEARSARIQSAVTPKGAGGSTPTRNSADDEFEAGFASERGG